MFGDCHLNLIKLVGGPSCNPILESAVVVGGLSAVAAGLVSQGIPKESAIKYEARIEAYKFVRVVHGTAEEVERAHAILSGTSPVTIEKHAAAAS